MRRLGLVLLIVILALVLVVLAVASRQPDIIVVGRDGQGTYIPSSVATEGLQDFLRQQRGKASDVTLLAFGGIALSEVFRRQGKLVLAEPLGRTGIMLPLLPVIGFWVVNSQVSYSALLLLAGLFYGCLSVMRRSFGLGLLAALAGNSGLWHFLHGTNGFGLSEHPQLWLIPAALSVLLAARINRSSLSAEQHSSIRYGALVVIYVSSTADIFLNGVDDSPWLPMVLAALSVGGVMAGLMLRIRPFLFLGTAFLLLSILTMIWSASVNLRWTWLWFVTGIALGVFILYSLAVFERRREEMRRFVERLRQWQ